MPDVAEAEVAGPGLHQHPPEAGGLRAASCARSCARARRYRRAARRAAGAGQRRICQRQPDRADACRPCARRGVRRRAREPARLCRARGDARILHQRRRRPGRRARALGASCATARRSARRSVDSRRALSRRLSRCPSARRSPSEFGAVAARPAGSGLAAAGARARDRRDDGDDSRGSARAQASSTTCSRPSGR